MSDQLGAAKKGFNCQFLQTPPGGLDSHCSICNNILREPYQAICCRANFCHDCIIEIESEGKACPACKKLTDFKTIESTILKEQLYSLLVYCAHKSEGCKWTGELGRLERHINSNPQAEDVLEGCPHTVIHCPFADAGCSVRLPRGEMEVHLKDEIIFHQLKQAAKTQSLLDMVQDLQRENISLRNNLEQENKSLKKTVDDLESKLQHQNQKIEVLGQRMAIGPAEFSMDGFEQYRQTDDGEWFSPPFWTHPQGYKMCLSVIANGEGPAKGQFISVLLHMMRGEYDDQLQWPFRGIVTVQLLDQQGGADHWTKEIYITKRTPDEVAGRVVDGNRSGKGWGLFQFISHSKLAPKYLKDDHLCFQIGQIQIQ